MQAQGPCLKCTLHPSLTCSCQCSPALLSDFPSLRGITTGTAAFGNQAKSPTERQLTCVWCSGKPTEAGADGREQGNGQWAGSGGLAAGCGQLADTLQAQRC